MSWTCAPASLCSSPQCTGGVGDTSGVLLDEFQGGGKEEGERGSVRGVRACEAEEWPSRAASARATTVTGGRRRRGDSAGGSCGRRGALNGARGKHEVVGGDGLGEATVRVRTVARSEACLLHATACRWLAGRVRRVWGVQHGVNNLAVALDALVVQ